MNPESTPASTEDIGNPPEQGAILSPLGQRFRLAFEALGAKKTNVASIIGCKRLEVGKFLRGELEPEENAVLTLERIRTEGNIHDLLSSLNAPPRIDAEKNLYENVLFANEKISTISHEVFSRFLTDWIKEYVAFKKDAEEPGQARIHFLSSRLDAMFQGRTATYRQVLKECLAGGIHAHIVLPSSALKDVDNLIDVWREASKEEVLGEIHLWPIADSDQTNVPVDDYQEKGRVWNDRKMPIHLHEIREDKNIYELLLQTRKEPMVIGKCDSPDVTHAPPAEFTAAQIQSRKIQNADGEATISLDDASFWVTKDFENEAFGTINNFIDQK